MRAEPCDVAKDDGITRMGQSLWTAFLPTDHKDEDELVSLALEVGEGLLGGALWADEALPAGDVVVRDLRLVELQQVRHVHLLLLPSLHLRIGRERIVTGRETAVIWRPRLVFDP